MKISGSEDEISRYCSQRGRFYYGWSFSGFGGFHQVFFRIYFWTDIKRASRGEHLGKIGTGTCRFPGALFQPQEMALTGLTFCLFLLWQGELLSFFQEKFGKYLAFWLMTGSINQTNWPKFHQKPENLIIWSSIWFSISSDTGTSPLFGCLCPIFQCCTSKVFGSDFE